ncbi:hypothetical protein K435DRAFT_869535 [Dendrothele bispora CBS 962.96]|uniref:Uncharacterized protein n=1 Tax=Dendrothele bispora (strain CBS 962.96) TaxID=1314807 RepID=A0A4S8LAA1_DENBC|nr:hypothetical protein K435DRAFT_869534 [Dendrothele bispora CBS 962.96]THU85209.1 hypothetical protein K435DRAFT_869535 [Dendrothele bispora CBS 962.96]
MAPTPSRLRPEDYNAFGYDPRGTIANSAALLFGANWRPDPENVPPPPSFNMPGPPRYGPPAGFQLGYLPGNFAPGAPSTGYLAAVPGYVAGPTTMPQATTAHAEKDSGARRQIDNFIVVIETDVQRKEITLNSDIPYEDFRSRICANLDVSPETAELGYRYGKLNSTEGVRSKYTLLADAQAFRQLVSNVVETNERARTQTTVLYFADLNILRDQAKKKMAKKGQKRNRTDDIPPDVVATNSDMSSAHFKKLTTHLQCSVHSRWCYIHRSGGATTHVPVDVKAATLWAKAMARDEADVYNPPQVLGFDHQAKRQKTRTGKSVPNVQVVIGLPDQDLKPLTSFGGSRIANSNGSMSYSASERPAKLPLSYPSIHNALTQLDQRKPDSDFISMEKPLRDAHIRYLDEVTLLSEEEIVSLTDLPLMKIKILRDYALTELADWRKIGAFHDAEEPAIASTNSVDDAVDVVEEEQSDDSTPEEEE